METYIVESPGGVARYPLLSSWDPSPILRNDDESGLRDLIDWREVSIDSFIILRTTYRRGPPQLPNSALTSTPSRTTKPTISPFNPPQPLVHYILPLRTNTTRSTKRHHVHLFHVPLALRPSNPAGHAPSIDTGIATLVKEVQYRHPSVDELAPIKHTPVTRAMPEALPQADAVVPAVDDLAADPADGQVDQRGVAGGAAQAGFPADDV
ncbi:hypothetical protein Landi51_08136 [Colletotrichum acutatum]